MSRPVLTVTPKMGDVAEGEDLTLTCTVQRGTPPITYTWYHTKSALPLLSKTTNGMRSSHSVQGVSREHGGGYYCVTNNPSNDSQRSAMVTVGGERGRDLADESIITQTHWCVTRSP